MKRKIFIFFILALAAVATLGWVSGRTEHAASPEVRIAVPDDSGGLIVHYILKEKKLGAITALCSIESIPVRDCCAAVFESAIASSAVDAAVMCPDAAARLIERDPRFEIAGPCVLNSDVVVCRAGSDPKRIGVAQRRKFQAEWVNGLFGPGCAVEPMIPAALPYAYEKRAVDGVVIDAIKAEPLEGLRVGVRKGGDTVTYVLAVAGKFKASPLYAQLLDAWARAVAELRDPAALAREIEEYSGHKWTDRDLAEFKNSGVTFVLPKPSGE